MTTTVRLFGAALVLALAGQAFAQSDSSSSSGSAAGQDSASANSSQSAEMPNIPEEDLMGISKMLSQTNCRVKPENISKVSDGEGYELKNVMCPEGNYDMTLDNSLSVASRTGASGEGSAGDGGETQSSMGSEASGGGSGGTGDGSTGDGSSNN